jgi:hypothetical protein
VVVNYVGVGRQRHHGRLGEVTVTGTSDYAPGTPRINGFDGDRPTTIGQPTGRW